MWPFCGIEHFSFNKRYLKNYSKNSRNKNETGLDIDRIVWIKKKNISQKKNLT